MIDSAENRYKFSRMLDKIGVDQPAWKELTSIDEAEDFANKVGYPVLVRPSYVLSGAAMNTVYSKDDLASYLTQAVDVSPDYPVVITKYIENAKEIEMDAVAKDGKMIMHVVSEHVENAGVHSGDATLIVPPQDLDPETVRRIVEATAKIGKALDITGPYNINSLLRTTTSRLLNVMLELQDLAHLCPRLLVLTWLKWPLKLSWTCQSHHTQVKDYQMIIVLSRCHNFHSRDWLVLILFSVSKWLPPVKLPLLVETNMKLT